MYSYRETIFRIKRENGELETSLREADVFFSAGEKRAEKRVCSPQANWKRAVINFVPAKRSSRGSYIKTRNLINGKRISQKALRDPFLQQWADF